MNDSPIRSTGIPSRCPHCGVAIDLGAVLAIAEGDRLPSDPVLGDREALRFRPSRFDVSGRPIDPTGAACASVACPSCRRELATLDKDARS